MHLDFSWFQSVAAVKTVAYKLQFCCQKPALIGTCPFWCSAF